MDLLLRSSKDISARKAALIVTGVISFALLDCWSAMVRIPLPFSPVPITLQTFSVLLAGALLGGAAGAVSQLLYIAFGFAGFSVFTSAGAGMLYLCGPTGGYLAGFVLAALICGLTVRYARGFAGLFFGFAFASMVILAVGTLWLGFVTGMTGHAAFSAGFMPFIPGDILKSITAAAVTVGMRKISKANQ